MKENKYTLKQIREAVDLAIGDDGFRGDEVVSILTSWNKYHEDGEPTTADEFNEEQDSVKIYDIRKDVITVIERIESVEQSLFNIDAKYKKKINEIMFLIEPPPSSQKLINKSKYSKENTNEETSKK